MQTTSFSLKHCLPAFLWAALLFFLSSLPSTALPNFQITREDLIEHFIAYSVLGYFLGIALMFAPANRQRSRVILAVLIGMVYGASDEFHQSFVPGRFMALSDWIADSVGVSFGVFVFLRFPRVFDFLQDKVFAEGRTSQS